MKTRQCTRIPPGRPRCGSKGPKSEFTEVDFYDGHGKRWYCQACAHELMELLGEHGDLIAIESSKTGEIKYAAPATRTVN